MAKAKTAVARVACPSCQADREAEGANAMANEAAESHLRLDVDAGLYRCEHGHCYTNEALRTILTGVEEPLRKELDDGQADRPVLEAIAGLKSGFEAPLGEAANGPAPALRVAPAQEPETGHGDAAVSRERAEETLTAVPVEEGKSSRAEDDVVASAATETAAALLPNGDLLVSIPIPEGMVGPVTELATGEGKTVEEWVVANFGFWLEDLFSFARYRG